MPPRSAPLGLLLFAISLVLTGCGPNTFLADRDRDIKDATRDIETARDNVRRAKAYSSRGVAYSEKARFSRITKLISKDEYERLFDLAMKDHNQAVALNPASAEVYFNRAQANYDRGGGDLEENTTGGGKTWFDAAALDFVQATEKDPKNELAFDRLGLTYQSNREADLAIQAYTQEMALNSHDGKSRLAELYCEIGFHERDTARAIAAYWKSIEYGPVDSDTCNVEPLGALVDIYMSQTHEYDKAWDAVHRAQKAGRWIASEVIERLKKESGRNE